MTDYFVKTDGNDGLDGLSWANAWQTVNKAATTIVAGDSATYRDGTYDMGAGQSTWNGGSGGTYVTHQAENEGLAIWEQSAEGSTVDLENKAYMKFIGLKIQGDNVNEQTALVRMITCDYIEFTNCTIGTSQQTVYGINGRGCTFVTVDGCTIDLDNKDATGGEDGIQIEASGGTASANWTITDTTISRCDHNGLSIENSHDVTATDCTFEKTGSHSASFNNSYNITLDSCTIRYSDTSEYDLTGSFHSNLRIVNGSHDITIQRCVLHSAATYNIYIRVDVTGNINLYNNTLYDAGRSQTGEASIVFDAFDTVSALTDNINLINNIVYVNNSTRAMKVDSDFEAFVNDDYNLWYRTGAVDEIRRNSTNYTFVEYQSAYENNAVVNDDPDFTDLGSLDFTLQAGSPAIDAGTNIGLPFQGSAPDMGAFEFQVSTVPVLVMVVVVVVNV